MTLNEKIDYMTIALAICQYGFPKEDVELFVSLYDKILETEGEVDLREIAKIRAESLDKKEKPQQ